MVKNSLDTPQEVEIFLQALDYGAGAYNEKAADALQGVTSLYDAVFRKPGSAYMSQYNGIIAEGYEKAAAALRAQHLSSLTVEGLRKLLPQILEGGRYTDDWHDNAVDVFKQLIAHLNEREHMSVLSAQTNRMLEGPQTQRLLEGGYVPGNKPKTDKGMG